MTPAEKIRKLIEEAEHLADDYDCKVARDRALRECLAIVEEAERERDDA